MSVRKKMQHHRGGRAVRGNRRQRTETVEMMITHHEVSEGKTYSSYNHSHFNGESGKILHPKNYSGVAFAQLQPCIKI